MASERLTPGVYNVDLDKYLSNRGRNHALEDLGGGPVLFVLKDGNEIEVSLDPDSNSVLVRNVSSHAGLFGILVRPLSGNTVKIKGEPL